MFSEKLNGEMNLNAEKNKMEAVKRERKSGQIFLSTWAAF